MNLQKAYHTVEGLRNRTICREALKDSLLGDIISKFQDCKLFVCDSRQNQLQGVQEKFDTTFHIVDSLVKVGTKCEIIQKNHPFCLFSRILIQFLHVSWLHYVKTCW